MTNSGKILVGVDGSEQGRKAFAHALQLSAWTRAELHVAAVIFGPDIEMAEDEERDRLMERQRMRLQQELDRLEQDARARDLAIETHLLSGQPAETLLELAQRKSVDHIIVGHRSKGLFERLLMGSVAKRVVDFAACSVTVVR